MGEREGERSAASQQVRRGLRWVGLSMALTRSLNFFVKVPLLTRILGQDMFGLFVVSFAAISVMNAMRELGFGQAFIQREDRGPDDRRRAANTIFWINVGVHLAFFAAAQLLVPVLVHEVVDEGPALEPIVRALLFTLVIDALLATPILLLQKGLQFGKHSMSDGVFILVDTALAVTLALSGFGAWSLVLALLVGRVCQAAFLYAITDWRPRLEFDRAIARELFSFGKYVWGFSVLSAAGRELDKVLLGRWVGIAKTGLYGVSWRVCNLPATQLAFLVNRVAFPALSRLQNDRAALRGAFLKAQAHVALLAIPAALGLIVVAPTFLPVYGGDDWSWDEAVPVVRVLALYGMTLAVSAVAGPALNAMGKPHLMLATSVLHHAIQFSLMWAWRGEGMVGVARATLVPMFVSAGISYALLARYLDLRVAAALLPIARVLIAAGVMMAAAWAWQEHVLPGLDARRSVGLLSSVAAGALAYVAASLVVNRRDALAFVETARGIVGR